MESCSSLCSSGEGEERKTGEEGSRRRRWRKVNSQGWKRGEKRNRKGREDKTMEGKEAVKNDAKGEERRQGRRRNR